jgi:hypothetical protein
MKIKMCGACLLVCVCVCVCVCRHVCVCVCRHVCVYVCSSLLTSTIHWVGSPTDHAEAGTLSTSVIVRSIFA